MDLERVEAPPATAFEKTLDRIADELGIPADPGGSYPLEYVF